jgi:protein gp37
VAEYSTIEWTDATWQPITGCSVVTPGCTNCYAMKLAGTRLRNHPSRRGLTQDTKAGPVWNGQVRFNEQWLTQPLTWRKPSRIFVCAHGDLFHEKVPDEWIDQVFAVMALAPQHTFQALTKRADRMRSYIGDLSQLRRDRRGEAAASIDKHFPLETLRWPLPNEWLGVSVEDQARADERIPLLLDTPAAVRFISAEPLLGPVDLNRYLWLYDESGATNIRRPLGGWDQPQPLGWIICGGESGPGARPMHPSWARSLRDQCAAAGVPFFFKQHGNWLHMPERAHFKDVWRDSWQRVESHVDGVRPALMFSVGKKAAGRLLDGRTHDDMPHP